MARAQQDASASLELPKTHGFLRLGRRRGLRFAEILGIAVVDLAHPLAQAC